MKPIRKLFVRNMRRLRKKNKLSQEALAEKLDVSLRHVQRLESKDCPSVGLDVIAKLAKALQAKPREFFLD